MRNSTDVSGKSTSSRGRPRGLTAPGLLAVVNGALVGVGSVYLTTHSAFITIIAAASAVSLAGLSLTLR